MDKLRSILDGKIDFQGQRLADRVYQELVVLVGALALFLGYVLQNLQVTLGIFAAALVVALLAVVPPWPFYNQHHVDWLPKRAKDGEEGRGAAPSTAAAAKQTGKGK